MVPEPEAARNLRRELLARIVPPLLHVSNNALAALRGGIELLEQGSGRVPPTFVYEQVDRLAAALDNLGHLARDPSDPPRTFELATLLDRALVLVGPLAAESGIELQRLEEVRAVVEGPEEGMLHLVVLELAGRIPEAPARGVLRLAVRRRGDTCCIRFVSTGLPEVAAGRREVIASSGRALAGALGGNYRARGGTRGGAAQLLLSAHSLVDLEGRSAGRGRVLLCAPEGEAAELCEAVLTQEGFHVRVDGSFEPGSGPFDVLVIDDALGEEAIRRLAARRPAKTPVLLLAGDLAGGVSIPCSRLPKPFGPRELVHEVQRLASGPHG